MVKVEFYGEMSLYLRDRVVEINLNKPTKLREVIEKIIQMLEEPVRKLIATNSGLRAVIVVNGAVESNYDRQIYNEDKIIDLSPVEGGLNEHRASLTFR
jgi:hypothetical protein